MYNKYVKLTDEQAKVLQELRRYYSCSLAEDVIDGSPFDNAVLDCLGNDFVETKMNMSLAWFPK